MIDLGVTLHPLWLHAGVRLEIRLLWSHGKSFSWGGRVLNGISMRHWICNSLSTNENHLTYSFKLQCIHHLCKTFIQFFCISESHTCLGGEDVTSALYAPQQYFSFFVNFFFFVGVWDSVANPSAPSILLSLHFTWPSSDCSLVTASRAAHRSGEVRLQVAAAGLCLFN